MSYLEQTIVVFLLVLYQSDPLEEQLDIQMVESQWEIISFEAFLSLQEEKEFVRVFLGVSNVEWTKAHDMHVL